jgi:hypothetical protein
MTEPIDGYRITVRPLAGATPPANRIKRWLKIGLRAFNLRAICVEEVTITKAGHGPVQHERNEDEQGTD